MATIVLVVAVIAVVVGVVVSQNAQTTAITGSGNALPTGVTKLGAGYPAFADVTAKTGATTVDIHEDFQCPACAQYEAVFGDTYQSLAKAGTIKLRYNVNNFLDDSLRNDSSTRAANAAFCAADAGKFPQFHNLVFANQPANEGDGFTDMRLTSFAVAFGDVCGVGAGHGALLNGGGNPVAWRGRVASPTPEVVGVGLCRAVVLAAGGPGQGVADLGERTRPGVGHRRQLGDGNPAEVDAFAAVDGADALGNCHHEGEGDGVLARVVTGGDLPGPRMTWQGTADLDALTARHAA